MLPDLDSNQDKQNQNLLYYRYTIGQSWAVNIKKKGQFFLQMPVQFYYLYLAKNITVL